MSSNFAVVAALYRKTKPITDSLILPTIVSRDRKTAASPPLASTPKQLAQFYGNFTTTEEH